MKPLTSRMLYELKASAYRPDRHLSHTASRSSIKGLVSRGLAMEHIHGCPCFWYVLTEAGLTLAAEHGITKTWADESATS